MLVGMMLVASAAMAPPAGSQPDAALGRLVVKVGPGATVAWAAARDREYNMKYAGTLDLAGGRIVFDKLPPGRRVDVEIAMAGVDGRQFIGVDLAGEEADLARQGRDADDEPPAALSDEDRKAIDAIVTKVEAFTDSNRVMMVRGDHARATALVELRRTTAFHDDRGERIRRVEVWHFQYAHGGWVKAANAERVICRDRKRAVEIEAMMRRQVFVPELGGLAVGAGQTREAAFAIPPTSQPDREK